MGSQRRAAIIFFIFFCCCSSSSSQIAQDFATLIDDPDQKVKTDYTETVVSMRQEHQTLASEQVSERATLRAHESVSAPPACLRALAAC